MGERLGGGGSENRCVARFVALVFLLSGPFYLIGPLAGSLSGATRAEVPARALMFVCPAVASVLLVMRRDGRRGIRRWLTAAFGRPATEPAAIGAAVLLLPLVLVVSYLVMRWIGMPLPDAHIIWSTAPALAALLWGPATLAESPLRRLRIHDAR